jgi:hypothetical protein
MPVRGGRAGGGFRGGGVRSSFRAPRSSSVQSSGSKGFRIPLGNQTPRAETSSSTPVHPHRPLMRPRWSLPTGSWWKILVAILVLFLFGGCACVGLGLALQYMGYGS